MSSYGKKDNCYAYVGMVLGEKYTLIKQIEGEYDSIIYLATVKQDSLLPDQLQQVAVKFLNKSFDIFYRNDKELFANEISMMRQLDSPFIVKFIEEISINPTYSYIIMEYCNQGTLGQWVQQHSTQIIDRFKKSIFIQILFAFKEFHSKSSMHRRICISDILIHNGTLKISDFGQPKQFLISILDMERSLEVLYYVGKAPEDDLHQYYEWTEAAEVFCLGLIFYQISKQKFPYIAKNFGLYNMLVRQEKSDYSGLSDNLIDLIQQMLRYDPAKRITFKDIIVHKFFSNDGEENFVNSAFGQEEFELQKKDYLSFYEKLQETEKKKIIDRLSKDSEVSKNSVINIIEDPQQGLQTSKNQNINEALEQKIKQSNPNPCNKQSNELKQQSNLIRNSSEEEFSLSKQYLENIQIIEAKCHALVKEYSDVQQNYMYLIMAAKRMVLLNMFCEENRQKFSVYIYPALLILKEKVTQIRQELWDELQGSKYAFLKMNSFKDFQKFEKQLKDDINHIEIFDRISKNQIYYKSFICYYKEFQGVLSECFIQENNVLVQERYKPKAAMIVIDILLNLTNPKKIGGNRDYKDKTDNSDILKRIQMVQRQACSYLTLACLVEKPNINIVEIEQRLLEGQNYQQDLKDQLYQLIQDVPDGNDPDKKDPMKLFLERKHKLLFN